MKDTRNIEIAEYDYDLPDERIAKYPLSQRDSSKLLLYKGGDISHDTFCNLPDYIPSGSLMIFNNTKVIQARLRFRKETGAQIEVFCLEPESPNDYQLIFQQTQMCEWRCLVGNSSRWKGGVLTRQLNVGDFVVTLTAERVSVGAVNCVRFTWDKGCSFAELLEVAGELPIPPYLNRSTEESDKETYQTVYSKFEGSVAAPTAGLHFTQEVIADMQSRGFEFEEVTLHVGAGTFLPVKSDDATQHEMHTEHFEVRLSTLKNLLRHDGQITAVGTTSVRTLESLPVLGWRVRQNGEPQADRVIGQWESYDIPDSYSGREVLEDLIGYMEREGLERLKASTQIMITPLGFKFRIVKRIVTNFHQPKSTLLLLVSAYVGDDWRRIYDYALENDFRFLSYGDSSLLIVE